MDEPEPPAGTPANGPKTLHEKLTDQAWLDNATPEEETGAVTTDYPAGCNGAARAYPADAPSPERRATGPVHDKENETMQAHNHTTPDTTRARLKGRASRSVAQALPAATADPGRLKAAARWSRGKRVATRPADLMEGRNPKTGARIVGTAEQISATASVQFDTFTRGEDGRLEYEHTGLTVSRDRGN